MPSLSDISPPPAPVPDLTRLGYQVEPGSFGVGRPDRLTLAVRTPTGASAVAKWYPQGGSTQAFENAMAVWDSSFGRHRSRLVVPEPLAHHAEHGILVFARHPGVPLDSQPRPSGDRPALEQAIFLLAELHESDAQPLTRRSARGIIRSLERRADWMRDHAPELEDRFHAVIALMERQRKKGGDLVPSHGDFSPRNLLVSETGLVVIDWDRFQWAEPARDVVYLGTSDWLDSLRRGRRPNRARLKRLVEAYESVRSGITLRPRVAFYVAAALLRRAASLVQLWPAERYLVHPLLNLASQEVL